MSDAYTENAAWSADADAQAELAHQRRLELERIERQIETHPDNEYLLTQKAELERLLRHE